MPKSVARGIDAAELALKGGEDYELLFRVSPKKRAALGRLAQQTRSRFYRIGTIRPQLFGRRVRTQATASGSLPVLSYRHF